MIFYLLTTIAEQLFWTTYLGGCFCDKFATNTVTNSEVVLKKTSEEIYL